MRSLSISCREEVLKRGLGDKSKSVNKIVSKDLSKFEFNPQTRERQLKGKAQSRLPHYKDSLL
jgi:hypothetical protein